MTSKILAASFFICVATTAVTAQSDKIHLVNGSVIENCKVTDYGVRSVRYKRGGSA